MMIRKKSGSYPGIEDQLMEERESKSKKLKEEGFRFLKFIFTFVSNISN